MNQSACNCQRTSAKVQKSAEYRAHRHRARLQNPPAILGADIHVGALTGEVRLAHPAFGHRCLRVVVDEGRQQVRMPLEPLPQQRQDAFVGDQCLPRRLDELRVAAGDRLAEVLMEDMLPGMQLEQALDGLALQVDEPAVVVQADVIQVDMPCANTRMARRPPARNHRWKKQQQLRPVRACRPARYLLQRPSETRELSFPSQWLKGVERAIQKWTTGRR